MPDIYDEIFEYAKEYIETNSSYTPIVLEDTPQQEGIFPLVIIKHYNDNLVDENLDKTDQRFKINYEIEIYSIDKENIPKQEIRKELIKLVNEVFDEYYGFTRRGNINIPNIDLNVDRQQMKYSGKLDEKNIIYRR